LIKVTILQHAENVKKVFCTRAIPDGGPVRPEACRSWCIVIKFKKKVNQSHYRSEVPRGFQEVTVPRLRDNGPGWW